MHSLLILHVVLMVIPLQCNMAWVLEGNVLECYVCISLGSCQITFYYFNFFEAVFVTCSCLLSLIMLWDEIAIVIMSPKNPCNILFI